MLLRGEARPRARRRVHGRPQALRLHARDGAGARRARWRRRASQTASSTSSPASPADVGRRWSPIRAWRSGVHRLAPGRRALAAQAAAKHLAPVLIELGGKSAQIVFADADLDAAANGVLAGIFAASGQTCVAGSRLAVQRSVTSGCSIAWSTGAQHPRSATRWTRERDGTAGQRRQLEMVLGFVERAVPPAPGRSAAGPCPSGRAVLRPDRVTGVRPEMEIAREEIFGPVLAVLTFDDEDEAVEMATRPLRAAAGVWTSDVRARTAWPTGCGPGRSGSTATASSRRTFRSAAPARAAGAARAASTRCTSTPGPSPSGSSSAARPATRSCWADAVGARPALTRGAAGRPRRRPPRAGAPRARSGGRRAT